MRQEHERLEEAEIRNPNSEIQNPKIKYQKRKSKTSRLSGFGFG
jgi:hypothetical protein